MRPHRWAGLIAGSLLILSGAAAQDAGVAIPLARAGEFFAQIERLAAADGGATWGVSLSGPTLFVDRASRSVVANRPDGEGHLTRQGDLYVGTLPPDVGIANTAVHWAGVHWTMVTWPLPRNRYARGVLMMHEQFHRVQDQLGFAGANPENAHLDSETGRTWLRLEWRALADALMHRGPARRTAIEDALTFRALRRSLHPDAVEEERALEMNEGLAAYTGYRVSGWPEAVRPDRAAQRVEEAEVSASFNRSFAYASGPAYGMLLDETDPTWRTHLTGADDLGVLLTKAAGIVLPEDLAAAAEERLLRYDGRDVVLAERRAANGRRTRLAAYRERFITGPVLTISLTEAVRYTYNPNGIEALDSAGSVYRAVTIRDEWGTLAVTEGALLTRNNAGLMARVRVPAPDGPGILQGAGWTLTLADGWILTAGERRGDFTVRPRN